MANRALVTGAYGFVGSVLCTALAEAGWEVVRCGLEGKHAGPNDIPLDIRDVDACANAIKQAGDITHVFHLAAVAHTAAAFRDPAASFEINAVGTIHLATAVIAHAPKARFLQIGSAAEYGIPQYVPIDEDHPLNPTAPYGISKVAAEKYCWHLHDTEGLDAVLLRPFNHTGPRQTDDYVLPAFARQLGEIAAGKRDPVIDVGNLDVDRDFLHVEDVVRAYIAAAEHGASGQVYNICSGEAYTIRAALDTMIEMSGANAKVRTDPGRVRTVDAPSIYGSRNRIHDDTGWEPAIPFDALLQSLVTHWRGVANQ